MMEKHKITKIGTIIGLKGKVWYNQDLIANIFSFANMIDKNYRIIYDSNDEDAFVVHTEGKTIK